MNRATRHKMHLVIFSLFCTAALGLDHDNYDYNSKGLIVANIKRRETIPLQQSNRRWLNVNNLNYRKTKDIREEFVDRHFQITEAQLREAQRRETPFRNAQINEIIEDKLNTRQRRVDPIINGMQVKSNGLRNVDMRDNQLDLNYNQRNSKYDVKDHHDNLRDMRWLTVDNGDDIFS